MFLFASLENYSAKVAGFRGRQHGPTSTFTSGTRWETQTRRRRICGEGNEIIIVHSKQFQLIREWIPYFQAFKEFVETFEDTSSSVSKVWVKAGTYDAGSRSTCFSLWTLSHNIYLLRLNVHCCFCRGESSGQRKVIQTSIETRRPSIKVGETLIEQFEKREQFEKGD